MLVVILRNKIRNIQRRDRTEVIDVVESVASIKWQWIGHVFTQRPDRWIQKVILSRPQGKTRSVG